MTVALYRLFRPDRYMHGLAGGNSYTTGHSRLMGLSAETARRHGLRMVVATCTFLERVCYYTQFWAGCGAGVLPSSGSRRDQLDRRRETW